MIKRLLFVALCLGLGLALSEAAGRTLDIFFIDVEGGQATLLVTPAGESLLIDAGYAGRGGRDPDRIMAAVREARLERLDYLLVTHFHPDHAGGVADLATRIPIGTFIDYGSPMGTDRMATGSFRNYEPVRGRGAHLQPKPGDRLPLKGIEADVVSAAGEILTRRLSGGGRENPACATFEVEPADGTENFRSIGLRVKHGEFRFVDLADLMGVTLASLVCPVNLLGEASVYLVPHHGNYDSNVLPVLVALRPRVAIMNNGAHQGRCAHLVHDAAPADRARRPVAAARVEEQWRRQRARRFHRQRGRWADGVLDQAERVGGRKFPRRERPHWIHEDLLEKVEWRDVRLRPSRVAAAGLAVWLLAPAASVTARAEDWPEFRGPTGQGHSSERGLPFQWSESQNVLWKTRVEGLGWSSPVVAGGRVWLTSAVSGRGTSLRAIAFDADTGRELVNVEVFRINNVDPLNPKNSFASPTPIIDGDRIYVHFGADGTAALSDTGDILWKTRLAYESMHGSGGSPVVYGDLLIFSCDGPDTAFVVALEKATGKTRWKTARRRPYDQAYSTPLLIRVGDEDQLVSVGAYRAAAYDPKTGQEIWRVGYPVRFPEGFSNVLRPVYGHGLVFISGGFNEPSFFAVRAGGRGDVTSSRVAWTLTRGAPLTPSPLLVGDELYLVSDTGVATCLDARSGQALWQARLGGNYSASPVFADGRIYVQSEEGITTVLAPGRTFQRLASNELDGAMLASMAVSNGSFFIRTHNNLYRIGGQR
jgi:outer membrane protein assembly factor BamB/beta-lactamase superfamily II metal-dependent hydrolase